MLISYREVATRFSHIDATFIRASYLSESTGASCEYVVRFYPWWEHPSYRAAIRDGQKWGFLDVETGAREVRVIAHNPVKVQLSQRNSVTDWDFCESHPALWEYESSADIICNSDVDFQELHRRLLARKMPYVGPGDLPPPSARPAPFALASLRRSLFIPVLEELKMMGTRVYVPHYPEARTAPLVVLLIDGEDMIVADDFQVDVPEFEHNPEWFAP